MLKRQTTGSVVCPSCGRLVGVSEERCFNCGRWQPGLWGYAPLLGKLGRDFGFTQIVLWGCVALYAVQLLLTGELNVNGFFGILAPSSDASMRVGASGAYPIFVYGRWWTVLSAGWLHGGLLHIFFNMMWIQQLAPAVSEIWGVGRLVIIYTVSSVAGFALTSLVAVFPMPGLLGFLRGAPLTLGASAALFGLFGALLYYGRRTGNSRINRQIMQWMVFLVVLGLVLPGVDNWAHFGGFAGGYVAAAALDPAKPEKPQHLLAGLACLAAMALAVIASLLIPIPGH